MTAAGQDGRRGRPREGVREAVLAATEAILSEVGIARLSTKEVARRAGVAESSIFYHFGDRLGLLQAVVQEHLPLVKQVLTELDGRVGQGELRDNLVALIDALEEFYLRVAPITAAIQSDSELRTTFATRSAELGIGPHRALDGVLGYLSGERAIGRLSADLDLRSAALILVGVANQRGLQRHLAGPETMSRPAASGEVVDTLMPIFRTGHAPTGD
jgi:AcrR family transcriptional regulator